MGGRVLNMIVFVVVVAIQLQSSMAQTTHVVGGAVGWQVPPGGATVYTTWASQQNFSVGDVLVFNFAINQHSVAEVTQAAFNACNATNPISLSTVSPTNLTLNTAGTHYFICTFGTHCVSGQRLTINVSAASTSPAPQPSTPPPVSTPPSPTPSMVSPPTSSPPVPSPNTAPTPSSIATPPSSIATPPSSDATPPSSDATPPSSDATPPSSPGSSPPSSTTPPTSPPPPGDATSLSPPPPSSAPSFAITALPVTLFSVALAFFI